MALWISWMLAAAGLLMVPAGQALPDLRKGAKRVGGPIISVRWRRGLVGGVGVAALLTLVLPTAGGYGLALGVIAAVAISRAPEVPVGLRPAQNRSELAVLCELWAGCLDAGLAMPTALSAVLGVRPQISGITSTGSSAARLVRVCGLLALGVEPAKAWAPAELDVDLRSIAIAARRSAAGGSALAAVVREHARTMRQTNAAAAQSRAGRAGVLMAAPLALCFLPSFICLGLAPVVIALLGTLGIGR